METRKKDAIRIVGIETRTVNAPGKVDIDIPALWGRFMAENIGGQLPSKLSEEIYCVYCEYEGDHNKPYTTLIGYSVPSDTNLPEGMKSFEIKPSEYAIFKSEGDLTGGAVVGTWNEIWQTSLDRTYAADFEIYGKEAEDPKNGKIEIFIGIN